MIRIIESTTYEDGKQHLEAYCLSTDDKPTDGVATGSIIRTVDTGKPYAFNETSSTWTEVNFNGGGGGGGGSSDFSTASVTVSMTSGQLALAWTLSDGGDEFTFPYVAESGTYDVILYKGTALGEYHGNGGEVIDVSGDIEQSGPVLFITGNGTITISAGE